MTDDDMPSLGESRTDVGVAVSKGVVSAIPWLGGALGELISAFVPNQRAERIENYLRKLDERLRTAQRAVENLTAAPIYADLVVEGGVQSARALTDQRIDEIATIVAEGLSSSEQKAIEHRRMLKIIGELDEDEIIFLIYHAGRNLMSFEQFGEKHAFLFEPLYASVLSPLHVREREALRDAAVIHLERLGLLRPIYKATKNPSAFDSAVRVGDHEATELGRVVLRHLKMMSGDEFTPKSGLRDQLGDGRDLKDASPIEQGTSTAQQPT